MGSQSLGRVSNKGTVESEAVVLSATTQGSFKAKGATGGRVRLGLRERRLASFVSATT